MTTLKGRIFQVNVSPGGVPTGQVAFGQARPWHDGKKIFSGYVFGANKWHEWAASHFSSSGIPITAEEQHQMGLGTLELSDWGSSGRPKRERELFRINSSREDSKFHNSQDQLICLFALERILQLQEMGHGIGAGSLGENLTTLGIDYRELTLGMLLGVGEENVRGILLRITSVRTPCATIEPFARIRNILDARDGPTKLNLRKDLGFVETDRTNPKWGGSGFYCSVEEIWGSGIVMVPDLIRIRD